MDWLRDIWSNVQSAFNTIGGSMTELKNAIDGISFNENLALFKFLGAVKFCMGDLLYMYTIMVIQIGAGFLLYKLIVVVVEAIKGTLPQVKGKFTFR